MYTLRYFAALLPLILLPCSAQAQHRAAEARPRAVKTAVSEGHRAASLISAYRAAHGLKSVRVDAHLIRPASTKPARSPSSDGCRTATSPAAWPPSEYEARRQRISAPVSTASIR